MDHRRRQRVRRCPAVAEHEGAGLNSTKPTARVGTLLIGVHQTRIANDIDDQDCHQPTFNTRGISLGSPPGRAQILANRPKRQASHRYENASSQQSRGKGFA
jgi:hypothetical protein